MSLDKIKPYAKTVVAVLGVIVTAVAQEFPDDPNVAHWCSLASTILTAVLVYVVPNRDPAGEKQDESVQPPDAGQEYDGHGAPISDPKRDDGRGYWGGI